MSKEIEIINQLEDLISDRLSFITDDKETSEIYQRDINAIKGIIELNKQLKENYEAVLRQRDDITKNATETIEKYQQKIDLYKSVINKVREHCKEQIDICDGCIDTMTSDLQEIQPRGVGKTYLTGEILKNKIAKKVYEEILNKVKGSDK